MSLTPPSAARLAALARLKSTVLQLPYNPLKLRTGLHYLTAPLRGPEVSAWYPVRLDDRVTREVLNLPKEWKNERWSLWKESTDRRLAKGKVPVRKGAFSSRPGCLSAAARWAAVTRPEGGQEEATGWPGSRPRSSTDSCCAAPRPSSPSLAPSTTTRSHPLPRHAILLAHPCQRASTATGHGKKAALRSKRG